MNPSFLKRFHQFSNLLYNSWAENPKPTICSDCLISPTLANRITIFRLLCVPIFILLIIHYNTSVRHHNPIMAFRWSATFIFMLTITLDAIDGYIARTKNQITRLGTIIDPLADKALLLSSILLLAKSPVNAFDIRIPEWFLLIVISRDFLLVIGSIIIHIISGNVIVHPRICGKAATFFQMLLISGALIGHTPAPFQNIIWIAASLVFISAVQYTLDGIKQLE